MGLAWRYKWIGVDWKFRRVLFLFFFKQKTAYEMCGRDWSSDVCSSDLTYSGCWYKL